MIKVVFEPLAIEQILRWTIEDLKTVKKIFQLVNNMVVTPYEGLGKPEQLKGNYSGFWSRRINQEHRIIYAVTNDSVVVISLYGHY